MTLLLARDQLEDARDTEGQVREAYKTEENGASNLHAANGVGEWSAFVAEAVVPEGAVDGSIGFGDCVGPGPVHTAGNGVDQTGNSETPDNKIGTDAKGWNRGIRRELAADEEGGVQDEGEDGLQSWVSEGTGCQGKRGRTGARARPSVQSPVPSRFV